MLEKLTSLYNAYVDTYRDSSGRLPEMMELKLVHTMNVVEAARRIAEGEGFDGRTKLACEAAALLHDTGRYEQLKLYNTFRDADSVDHAVFSHDIVKSKGWLDGWDLYNGAGYRPGIKATHGRMRRLHPMNRYISWTWFCFFFIFVNCYSVVFAFFVFQNQSRTTD